MGFYEGKAGKKIADTAKAKNDGFKKGGKTGKADGGMMSEAHEGRKPRKDGGGVFSSAAAGTPRAKGSNY